MFDLFSSDFLTSLREEVRNKAKTSKALLEAIKDLSHTNQNNKVNKFS